MKHTGKASAIFRSLMVLIAIVLILIVVKADTKAHAENGPTRVYSAGTGVVWGHDWFKEGDIYYYIAKKPQNGKHGEVYAAGCDDGFTGSIKVPAKVRHSSKDYDVLGVNDYAFSGKQIKSVEIADGVGLVSDYAFYNCTNLEKVKLGADITKIGSGAFSGCEKLETINLPNTIKSIGESCFVQCSSLGSITLPSKITEIPAAAFTNCSSLKSIKLPKNVKTIGDYAFRSCSALKEIKFSKALTGIGKYAFAECTSLKKLNFTKNIKELGESAFSECSSLESVKMNKKCTVIPSGCFTRCTSLKTVTLSSQVKSIGYMAFFSCRSLEKVKGSNLKLKTIGEMAFQDTPKLQSISLKAVEEIGGGAFGSSGLHEAELGDGLKTICGGAFSGSHLRSIKIPGSVREIGKEIFRDCYWLKSAYFGDGIDSIPEGTFEYCYSLKTISIPDSVHFVGKGAFERTLWLADKLGQVAHSEEDHEEDGDKYTWSTFDYLVNNAYDYSRRPEYVMVNDVCIWIDNWKVVKEEWGWTIKPLEVLTFPNGAKIISGAFHAERETLKVIIPEGVEVVDGSFNCGDYGDDITISFPSTLKELNWRMVGNRLKSLTLPENLESIGDSIFNSIPLENFTSVTFTGKKLKKIGSYAFMRTKLEKIVLPEGLEEIGENAFFESSLTSVTFPSTLKSIGDYAFYKTGITKIDLPNGLENIGRGAFDSTAIKDTSITLPKFLKTMGSFAFEGTAIKTIKLPDNFEINCDPLNDHYAEFIVKTNSKAHKALLAYIEEKRERDWKVKTR